MHYPLPVRYGLASHWRSYDFHLISCIALLGSSNVVISKVPVEILSGPLYVQKSWISATNYTHLSYALQVVIRGLLETSCI